MAITGADHDGLNDFKSISDVINWLVLSNVLFTVLTGYMSNSLP